MTPTDQIDFRITLCTRLREARTAQGMTQAMVAERAGLPPSLISHYESGRRCPAAWNLATLADTLHVRSDYLLGLVDQ